MPGPERELLDLYEEWLEVIGWPYMPYEEDDYRRDRWDDELSWRSWELWG